MIFFRRDKMNKIATLLIISIALIAMGTVSAFSDADHIVEAPFTVASMDGHFNVPLYLPFAAITVDNSFIFLDDVSNVPFDGYVNIPFAAASVNGPFSLPIVGSDGPSNIPLNIPFAAANVNGPFSLPIVGSDGPFNSSLNIPLSAISVGGPFSLPIIGTGNPLDIILNGLNYFNSH